MRHEALFTFHTQDAPIIAASLMPESDTHAGGRTWGECSVRDEASLAIHIHAEDLTALRAALNTWLRLVQIADEMVQTTKKAGTTNE